MCTHDSLEVSIFFELDRKSPRFGTGGEKAPLATILAPVAAIFKVEFCRTAHSGGFLLPIIDVVLHNA